VFSIIVYFVMSQSGNFWSHPCIYIYSFNESEWFKLGICV